MLRPRIIPCLLIHNYGLVKTIQFKSPRYIGDPINAVRIFNEKEVDELIVLDIDSTVNSREPNYEIIAKLANECRMPLCYGGGVKSVDQAKKIISLGVEKISISSCAIENPEILLSIVNEIGRQSVVVTLDVMKTKNSNDYIIFLNNGKENTQKNVINHALLMEKYGAGELIINSINNDGLMNGYDLFLAKKLKNIINIPISILGGAGSLDDIERLISTCGLVGACAGSLFIYKGALKGVLINYPSIDQREQIYHRVFGGSI